MVRTGSVVGKILNICLKINLIAFWKAKNVQTLDAENINRYCRNNSTVLTAFVKRKIVSPRCMPTLKVLLSNGSSVGPSFTAPPLIRAAVVPCSDYDPMTRPCVFPHCGLVPHDFQLCFQARRFMCQNLLTHTPAAQPLLGPLSCQGASMLQFPIASSATQDH